MRSRSALPFLLLLGLFAASLAVPAGAQEEPAEGTEETAPAPRRPLGISVATELSVRR
jgi:hypothetical protein